MRKILASCLLMAFSSIAYGQSGTNSPYSQFGLGMLSPQSAGFNRGMNGVAYGFHEHNQVNSQNPASYSAVDSLTFIFDAGVALQLTNFEENGRKKNARNADIEYVVASFRAFRNVGISFGLLPYTTVGYKYSNTANVNAFPNPSSGSATYSNAFSGDGGVRILYLGAGWEAVKGLSVGINLGYLWGTIDRSVVNTYSDAYMNKLSKTYNTEVASYKVDLGLQYTRRVSRKDELTLGLAYSLGHQLDSDPKCDVISTNTQTSVTDTTHYNINNALEFPHTFGVGLMWNHNNRLKLGFDYELQKWGKIDMPQFHIVNGISSFVLTPGQLKDRQKLTLGGEYCRGERYRGFFSQIHYRAGVGYASPYIKINGLDGPREMSASLGVGIPIVNSYNNRSILNISGEWVNRQATGMIKENMFRINVGLTFNERWFSKFKVE